MKGIPTYREMGYDSFLIRSIEAARLDPLPDSIMGSDLTYSDLKLDYGLSHQELVLPKFSYSGSLPRYNYGEVRALFPPGSIPAYSLSSDLGGTKQFFKWIDDETPPPGASDTGWLSPSAYEEKFAGTYPWTTPANGYASDAAYASIEAPRYGPTMGIFYKTFNASIPGGATVTGLEMKCDCYRTNPPYLPQNTTTFYHARTLLSLGNDQKLYLNKDWPTSVDTVTIGAGGSWHDVKMTPTYMNDSNWGIGIDVYSDFSTVTYYVDWVRVKIYYTT